MIETEEQRRWWFATHPEFSASRRGTRGSRQRQENGATGKVRPEDVDAYVDEALKYETGPVAELLKSVKRNFGTAGTSQEEICDSQDPRWDTEAGGRTGSRQGPRSGRGSRRELIIRDWLHRSKQERRARELIEAELERGGANPRDYRLTYFFGRYAAQRDSIWDPHRVDPQGRTNNQRVREKRAPLDNNGDPIVLHHADQRSDGPIIEMTAAEHASVPIRRDPSQINRAEFRIFRETYWAARAASIRSPESE